MNCLPEVTGHGKKRLSCTLHGQWLTGTTGQAVEVVGQGQKTHLREGSTIFMVFDLNFYQFERVSCSATDTFCYIINEVNNVKLSVKNWLILLKYLKT